MNRLRCVNRQHGVVLVVAMLLLLVLTLLGTTGLVTAVLELRMAANARYQARAFQAAEYGIQQAVHATGLATTITLASPRLEPAAGAPLRVPGTPQDSYSYRLYYDTSTPPRPLVDGTVPGPGLRAYHFVAEATGWSERGATETHVQGFYLIASDPPPASLTPPACAPGCSEAALYEPHRTFWMQVNAE